MITEGEHLLWDVRIQLQYFYCLLHYFGQHSFSFNNLLFFTFKENGEIPPNPHSYSFVTGWLLMRFCLG